MAKKKPSKTKKRTATPKRTAPKKKAKASKKVNSRKSLHEILIEKQRQKPPFTFLERDQRSLAREDDDLIKKRKSKNPSLADWQKQRLKYLELPDGELRENQQTEMIDKVFEVLRRFEKEAREDPWGYATRKPYWSVRELFELLFERYPVLDENWTGDIPQPFKEWSLVFNGPDDHVFQRAFLKAIHDCEIQLFTPSSEYSRSGQVVYALDALKLAKKKGVDLSRFPPHYLEALNEYCASDTSEEPSQSSSEGGRALHEGQQIIARAKAIEILMQTRGVDKDEARNKLKDAVYRERFVVIKKGRKGIYGAGSFLLWNYNAQHGPGRRENDEFDPLDVGDVGE